MKKIIITGIGDTRNNGCWAMVVSAIKLIVENSPIPLEFVILTRKNSLDYNRLNFPNVKLVTRPWTMVSIPKLRLIWSLMCIIIMPLNAFAYRLTKAKSSKSNFWDCFLSSDLILDLSGDSLSSDYSNFSLATLALPLLIARLLKKPYMICAESVGPFSNNVTHKLLIALLKEASVITTRERLTDKILNDLGIYRNIVPTQDLAFALKPASDIRVKEICEKEEINPELSWIAMSISGLISHYAFKNLPPDQRRTAYLIAMSELADYIVTEYGYNLIFIPHVVIPNQNSDLNISLAVYERMRHKEKAVVVKGDYLGNELKGIIGLCDILIGSRMHATIASLSQCIPTITYVYNHKTLGINGEIMGQQDCLIDIRSINDSQLFTESKKKVDLVFQNKDQIKKQLTQILPQILPLSVKNAEIAVGLLEVAGPLKHMKDPLQCTGCGTCAGVCSNKALELQKTPQGTLRPRLINACDNCKRCLKVCPALGMNISKHEKDFFGSVPDDAEIGKVIRAYKGYAENQKLRQKCSSGGLVSAVLQSMIEENVADAVLVTGDNAANPMFPKPFWARSPEEIRLASGSKYTPVPLMEAFSNIPENVKKLAVVGLPCHLWGLRLLEKSGFLKDKEIVMRLGLFCGRTPSVRATEFIIQKLGIGIKEVKRLKYRGDGWPGEVQIQTNQKLHKFSHDSCWKILGSPYYHSRHCFMCPDFSAHLSDMSFGDAWLPEYSATSRGYSLCIIRSKRGEDFFRTVSDNNTLYIEELTPQKIKQAIEGNIKHKYRYRSTKGKFLKPQIKFSTREKEQKKLFWYFGVKLDLLLMNIGASTVLQEKLLNFPMNRFMRLNNKLRRYLYN